VATWTFFVATGFAFGVVVAVDFLVIIVVVATSLVDDATMGVVEDVRVGAT